VRNLKLLGGRGRGDFWGGGDDTDSFTGWGRWRVPCADADVSRAAVLVHRCTISERWLYSISNSIKYIIINIYINKLYFIRR